MNATPAPSRERLLARIAEWSTEASQRARGRVEPSVVHKTRPENVVLARIEPYDPDAQAAVAEILVDTAHPFFFEHEIDHVPALLLMEAVRQTGIAAAHACLGLSLDTGMIVDDFTIHFEKYAELDLPSFIAMNAADKVYRGDRLVSVRLAAEFLQAGETIGRASIGGRLLRWAR